MKIPCSKCGDLKVASANSLPEGQLICQACRRRARERARAARVESARQRDQVLRARRAERVAQAAAAKVRTCGGCRAQFLTTVPQQRFCSPYCRAVVLGTKTHNFNRSRPNPSRRGYNAAHQRERLTRAAEHSETDPCVRCGKELGPMGPHLHLDHSDDRSGYLGFAHASCNRKAGASIGAKRRNGAA